MVTYSPKVSEIERDWHLVDAEGLVLGRLATEVARLLRGKHKPVFSSHIDVGDYVVIVNAEKVVLTSGKARSKFLYRHSGYPGGLSAESYESKLLRKPYGTRFVECCLGIVWVVRNSQNSRCTLVPITLMLLKILVGMISITPECRESSS